MRSALVTGANKGIGYETVKLLSQKGYKVYLGCRDIAKGQDAVQKLNREGVENVEAVQLDVTDSKSVDEARKFIGEKTDVLDVLINNAGISGGDTQSALNATIEQFQSVYNTNVFGVVRVTEAFIDLLKKSDEPRIVNVSSAMGSLTLAADTNGLTYNYKLAVYQSSKSALNMYTVNLAYELRDLPFKVNAVCPGYTQTDFTDQQGTSTVQQAAGRITKYAVIGQDGPTGQYFSEEYFPESNCPW